MTTMKCRSVPVIAMDGNIVAAAMNEVVTRHDPTAHAEVLVIRKAAAMLGNERLNGATLYVTLEPCPMCAAACSLARLARVVWGADDPDCGGMRGAIVDGRQSAFESPSGDDTRRTPRRVRKDSSGLLQGQT